MASLSSADNAALHTDASFGSTTLDPAATNAFLHSNASYGSTTLTPDATNAFLHSDAGYGTTISTPVNALAQSSINTLGKTPSAGGSQGQTIPATITQTERLYTTRSRAINFQGTRGQTSYIKVMSGDPATSLKRHVSAAGTQSSLGDSSKGPLVDAITSTSGGYASFLLTDIQGQFSEKLQVVTTFGDGEVAYYFGRQPITINFTGILIDSPDNYWFVQWIQMYAKVMRGSQLARNYELLKIVTPNMTFIGSVTGMVWNQSSQRDVDIPFSFTFLAKQIIPMPISALNSSISAGTSSIISSLANTFRTQAGIVSQKNQLTNLVKTIQNPFSTVSNYASSLMGTNGVMNSVSSTANKLGFNFGSSSTPNQGGGATLTTVAPGLAAAGTNGDAFVNVSSNLAGMRASLFSPTFGVLSSLTKLISSATGSSSSVVSTFNSPTKNILRDITNVTSQAVGIVSMLSNSSVPGSRTSSASLNIGLPSLQSIIPSMSNTSGIISTAPQTIVSSLRNMVSSGTIPLSVPFLNNNSSSGSSGSGSVSTSDTTSKTALLYSGPDYAPETIGATA